MSLPLGHSQKSVIATLARALEARDAYTAGHGTRVATLSAEVAAKLGLPSADIEMLRIGAKLHDIGKIGIPDAILLKPGPLTEEERGLMKFHTRIGRMIVEKAPELHAVSSVVELHHENVDGSGYPYGLRGSEIPLLARIVRVTDAYDAMITDRVYRGAFSNDAAMDCIRREAGKHFDPEVAEAFRMLVGPAGHELYSTAALLEPEPLWTPA